MLYYLVSLTILGPLVAVRAGQEPLYANLEACDALGSGCPESTIAVATTIIEQTVSGTQPWPTPQGYPEAVLRSTGVNDGATTATYTITSPVTIAVPTIPPRRPDGSTGGGWTIVQNSATLPGGSVTLITPSLIPLAYKLDDALGYQYPDIPVSWNTRDLILYALGIGASREDLRLIYEKDPNFAAFPTYPSVLSFKGNSTNVVDFYKNRKQPKIPGLPEFPPAGTVQHSQCNQILKPIPRDSGDGWKIKKSLVGVHETEGSVIIDNELLLVSPSGEVYTRMISSSLNIGGKANGVEYHKTLSTAIKPSQPIPNRAPDQVATYTVSETQTYIFRLSGDYNPLHADPNVGLHTIYGGLLLHAVSYYGFAARQILDIYAGGDQSALEAIATGFGEPVKPGDNLELNVWELGPGPEGTVELAFLMKDLTSGKVVLSNAVAYVRKPAVGDFH